MHKVWGFVHKGGIFLLEYLYISKKRSTFAPENKIKCFHFSY
jgi:hypothetical protein